MWFILFILFTPLYSGVFASLTLTFPSDPKVRAEANGQRLEGASQPHPAELRGLKMCLQVQKMTKAITWILRGIFVC